jgi:hypothetical protein
MGVLQKCAKRRCYPIDIDGETIHVRAITLDEMDRMQVLDKDTKTFFLLACGIVEANGDQGVSAKRSDETDAAWVTRVTSELSVIPADTALQIVKEIDRVSKPAADLEKK